MTESVEARFSTFVPQRYGCLAGIIHQPWSDLAGRATALWSRRRLLLRTLCRNGTEGVCSAFGLYRLTPTASSVQRLARDAGLSGRPEMVAALRYPLNGRLSALPLSATTSINGLSAAAVFTGAAQKVITTGSARFFSMALSEKPAMSR